MVRVFIILVLIFLYIQCGDSKKEVLSKEDSKIETEALFTLLYPSETKLNFINVLNEGPAVNGLVYEYLYNGGGVAVGDFNNDDLPDIYFISNLYSNKLFINQGDLIFKETTSISKVNEKKGFPTGVALVDINSDGLLDIYVCKSGDYKDIDLRRNELYVNQGNNDIGIPIFIEDASSYNLDLPHYSTQAAFFDYDRDGDLDMFLINHGIDPADVELNLKTLVKIKSKYSSERLFRNDNGKFKDVSAASGIVNNSIGFGLGIAISDLNNDQWPDMMIGQDYSEKDHLYLNQQDGNFKEVIKKATGHISNASMGNDVGDINNDGWQDIFSLDMASINNYEIKTSMKGMDPKRFQNLVDLGLHRQYMFNTLQLNNGHKPGDSTPIFSDIAQFSGVASTNWTWTPLFFDMDNDGWQDIFVSNGIMRAFRNIDFVEYKRKRVGALYKDLESFHNKDSLIELYYEEILAIMPEKKETNFLFLNNQDFTFSSMNEQWELNTPSCSNGAAYADLDNDGDLDIITNNLNDVAFIYRNNARELQPDNNYIKIKFAGSSANKIGIGAKVTIEAGGIKQTKELYLSRGFQSSVSRILHFGIGNAKSISSLSIEWPDGKYQSINEVEVNQQITLNYNAANDKKPPAPNNRALIFKDISDDMGVMYKHVENEFDDFSRESLLPHKLSQNGPALAIGDVNKDGLDDFYIGGAKNQKAELFMQQSDGTFISGQQALWSQDRTHEDISADFFDADQDGDIDLYVVSGSNEEIEMNEYYRDRFYENLGDGKFSKSKDALPDILSSGSCIKPGDYDGDGDLDLFIGGRMIPGRYPLPANSYLLKNVSQRDKIKFVNVTEELAPFMTSMGMVTDANWVDLDDDKMLDLVILGEWMQIRVIANTGSKFEDKTKESGLENQKGWWYSISTADFDDDGDSDFIVGNLGLNYKYKASNDEPFEIYANDFDNNGSLDAVLGYHENGIVYPVRGKECFSKQMPFIKNKFPTYHEFGKADITTVFGKDILSKSLHYKASTFATIYIENLGNLKFEPHEIEGIAQFSSVNSIVVEDFNHDGNLDALLSGNLYQAEVETTRIDASNGVLLSGDGAGHFTSLFPYESGLFLHGEVKNAGILNTISGGKKRIVFGKNDEKLQFIEYGN